MKVHDLPRILWIVAIVLLVAAVARHPYAYYEILRIVVTSIAALIAIAEFLEGRSIPERRLRAWAWSALFLFAAVLFNPVHPIYLRRGTWFYADLIVALGLAAHFIIERRGLSGMRR